MKNPVHINLEEHDGNAFALMGSFRRAAKKSGWNDQEISLVTDECMRGDYDHLLRTLLANTERDES